MRFMCFAVWITLAQQGAEYGESVWLTPLFFSPGSLGELDGIEENTADNLSLSGEDGGASDPEDSAEGDGSSPPPYTPLYNEGERRKTNWDTVAYTRVQMLQRVETVQVSLNSLQHW